LKAEGKKWVRHFGCAGCHEISGLEDEGRIGTELTIEGSKPIERLDFALSRKLPSAVAANPSPTQKIKRVFPKALPKHPGTTKRLLRTQTRGAEHLGYRVRNSPNKKIANANLHS